MRLIDQSGGSLPKDSDVIRSVPIESADERVKPRQVFTGSTRGEQQIRGSVRVVDDFGVPRLIMGFKENGF